jgi:hypothetical protein
MAKKRKAVDESAMTPEEKERRAKQRLTQVRD